MTRKINLAAALHEASGKKKTVSMVENSDKSMPVVLNGRPQSRAGKKSVTGHFDPAVIRQLKILAMDNDSSIQALLAEALNDLFDKHGMKPLA